MVSARRSLPRVVLVLLLTLCYDYGAAAVTLAAPLVATATTDATAMVGNLVPSSSGLTIVPGSAIYTGAATASALFTGGTGILPFDSGIVLTTGGATFVTGPNDDPGFTVDNEAPGDATLTGIVGGAETFNASSLSFRFTPTTNTVSFQFVFGSEEYNEFVGSEFNDAFAFLLNGQNIAFVPGTNTPIAINSVNNDSHSDLFTDNENGALDTQLDGLVGVSRLLLATGTVTPDAENTIRIVIADTSDIGLDSAVFLRGGSFIAVPPPPPPTDSVPEPRTLLLLGAGVAGLAALARSRRRAE